jgi:U6 snRNA-associated Sm-like protein LSm4
MRVMVLEANIVVVIGICQLVELKNGETYNGSLFNIDTWMNLNLREVVRTSRDGESFWSIPEMYIRGNTIKYMRVPDVVVDVVAEEKQARESTVRYVRDGNLHLSSYQRTPNLSITFELVTVDL